MTDQERQLERATKALASARSHIEYFKGKEAEHRALIEKGGPFPDSEAHSFAMAKYYNGRVAEQEGIARTEQANIDALRRPPLA